jgi:hypothetical protein
MTKPGIGPKELRTIVSGAVSAELPGFSPLKDPYRGALAFAKEFPQNLFGFFVLQKDGHEFTIECATNARVEFPIEARVSLPPRQARMEDLRAGARFRLGFFLDPPLDKWWVLRTRADLERDIRSGAELFRTHFLTYVARVVDQSARGFRATP